MSIYFLEAQGLIKIGYSANPAVRTRAVMSAFADGGKVLGVLPGDRELEKHFHDKFAEHRSHGEWFKPSDEMAAVIALCGERVPTIDKVDERSLVQIYEDKYAEDCADCLHAAKRAAPENFFASVSAWSGISVRRLTAIYGGTADSISSAEYTIIRALAEEAGFTPSLLIDSRRAPETEG